ncbi:MAG TPA: hypothetical protein VLF14_07510 [Candidatus Binatia bacterium]|nr:hypothetical protein [Candidatus Binatia bacterium]
MPTDVKLDQGANGNWVVIEGDVLKAAASDFILVSDARRKNSRKLRRALVHDANDGLTINFNRDYPGGVTINDVVALNNRKVGVSMLDVRQISGVVQALEPGQAGGGKRSLVVLGEILFEPSKARSKTASLQGVLEELQSEVVRLTQRVDELERRISGSLRRK